MSPAGLFARMSGGCFGLIMIKMKRNLSLQEALAEARSALDAAAAEQQALEAAEEGREKVSFIYVLVVLCGGRCACVSPFQIV